MTTHRYHTRAAVLVHSHLSGKLDLSGDVVRIETSKAIKGSGGFNLTLVPRKNYLNLLFPNDVVNIYFDPGDGRSGFVRTFMGYIDRVERTESTNAETGASTSEIKVVGTDFSKAVEKTEIYFNPHLANRTDLLDARFGQQNIGGHSLRTRGLATQGTPALIVENTLTLLLGHGSQWVLPDDYPEAFVEASRKRKLQRTKSRITTDVSERLATIGWTLADFSKSTEDLISILSKEAVSILKKTNDPEVITTFVKESYRLKQEDLRKLLDASAALKAYKTAVSEINSAPSILDVISTDFVESLTMDGYMNNASVWSGQGSVSKLLYGNSNEIVNELCFDLRPVAAGGNANDACFGDFTGGTTTYSKESDELGVNTDGTDLFDASVAAVQYRPALIFREYPYSVVEGLDMTGFYIEGSNAKRDLGINPFGPIFAMNPNVPGRHFYNYEAVGVQALTPEACKYEGTSKPLKHIDVVVINNSDVINASVGRSDHDAYNLFAIYANNGLNENNKYLTQGFLPILTPISIERNGLRVRELTTKFATYGKDNICKGVGSARDVTQVRRSLIRWSLLLDHWNQHNTEYLSGSIALRGMPEIRVGYRLDWKGKNESYYVEQVNHSWAYPSAMKTTIQVSRGQRNDPFPSYVPPTITEQVSDSSARSPIGFVGSAVAAKGGGDRTGFGRLAESMFFKDTSGTTDAVRNRGQESRFATPNAEENALDDPSDSDFEGYIQYAHPQRVQTESFRPQVDSLLEQTIDPVIQKVVDVVKGKKT